MKNLLISILLIGLLSLCWLSVDLTGKLQTEIAKPPKVIVHQVLQEPEIVERILKVPVIEYQTVTRTVTKVEYKDKIVEVPQQVWQFKNSAELRQWLAQFEQPFLFDGETMTTILRPSDSTADCDDYARSLQLKAFHDGYITSVALVRGGVLFGETVTTIRSPHMGNLVIADNNIIYFDPYPPYSLVFVATVDTTEGLQVTGGMRTSSSTTAIASSPPSPPEPTPPSPPGSGGKGKGKGKGKGHGKH